VDLSQAVVLGEEDVRVLVVGTEEFFDYHETQRGNVRFRYTVREGDTLSSLAQRFELSVGSIGRINRFSRDTLLRAGQEIIIYAPRNRVPARLLAAPATETAPSTVPAVEAEAAAEPAPGHAAPPPDPA
jgi:membrane-bound lytic murein transglycosylase D